MGQNQWQFLRTAGSLTLAQAGEMHCGTRALNTWVTWLQFQAPSINQDHDSHMGIKPTDGRSLLHHTAFQIKKYINLEGKIKTHVFLHNTFICSQGNIGFFFQ